ncbi:MAG: hypothetical protein DRP03_02060 [Candidatus Aenigmatarchaeota archaeon]|nr:MAG: hypothetical protein DRP03_02060 [Candidatus Aenigmarchaeota archaeon]
MDWKEFFRATKIKVVAFCLLILIVGVLPTPRFLYYLYHIGYGVDYSPIILLPVLTIMGIIALIFGKLSVLSLILMLLTLILILAVTWSLSCLITVI